MKKDKYNSVKKLSAKIIQYCPIWRIYEASLFGNNFSFNKKCF